jgi:hypothetical protein
MPPARVPSEWQRGAMPLAPPGRMICFSLETATLAVDESHSARPSWRLYFRGIICPLIKTLNGWNDEKCSPPSRGMTVMAIYGIHIAVAARHSISCHRGSVGVDGVLTSCHGSVRRRMIDGRAVRSPTTHTQHAAKRALAAGGMMHDDPAPRPSTYYRARVFAFVR